MANRDFEHHGRNLTYLLENLLVSHMRSRGYRIVVAANAGDRLCWLANHRDGPKLNLTELAKDLTKDLTDGENPKSGINTLFPDG